MRDAEPRSRCPDRLRLAPRFDPAPLAADLATLREEDWTDHFVPQNYDGRWSAAALRAPAGAAHPIMMIAAHSWTRDYVDAPLLARLAHFRALLDSFRCPLQSARLMRLAPGSTIKEHSDPDLSFEDGFARLHVPIVTDPAVGFYLNGRRVEMEPGSLWYLRLSDPHRVTNESAIDRVHLVIDAIVDDWLRRLFDAALADAPPSPESGAVEVRR